ncbi:MAG: 4Fe-4S cluster-binding domain-containing protein [Candidatus Omnitrophica bacterium]|nr:4Fe-4S cluster-binding domain-containing protein [Candidatus Omnitrophota bacterium]
MKKFWNWDIHYECNYRCTYCFLAGKWDQGAKENRYPGIKKWLDVWGKIFKKYGECHIHFSGGEPFTYPDFFDFIVYLSGMSTLEFSTNLSFDVDYFIRKLDPGKVRLNPSYHPEFADFDRFLKDALLLIDANFPVSVSFVAYPPHLKMMNDLRREFTKKNITFIVQPFRGEFEHRVYPDAYTESEKGLIDPCKKDTPSSETMFDHHLKEKSGTARLCRMGETYGKIYACADVYRCCSTGSKKIGNLLDDADFKLLDSPEPCQIKDCACWKSMLVGEEDRWSAHWR